MGVIVKERKPGEWWVFINHNGKRKAKKVGSQGAAVEVAKRIEARLVLGDFDMSPAKKVYIPTLSEFIDGWKKGGNVDPGWIYSAELKLKRSTLSSYKKNLKKHVKPYLGKRNINSVTPKDVSDLIIKALKNGKRSQTVKNIKNCLSSIFEKARTDGYVQANPCRGVLVPVPEDERPKREPDPFSWEDRQKFEKAFKRYQPFYYPLVVCGFRTGLRIGELIGLKWADIDMENRQIFVQHNIAAGRLTTPKSKSSRRFVRMTSQLISILTWHRNRLEGMLAHRFRKLEMIPEWVFPSERGRFINYSYFINRVWNPVMDKSKLRRRTPHDMRHTYATLRLSNGDSLAEVSKEMGHGSADVTFRTYYKWLPKESKTDIDALDGKVKAATGRNPSATKNKKEVGLVG